MKHAVSFLICCFSIYTGNTQTISRINWLHRSDLVVGREAVRLGVKEVYQDNEVVYLFEIMLNGKKDTVQILASDFVKGEYLEKLFLTKLKSKYDHLRQPNDLNDAIRTRFDSITKNLAKDSQLETITRLELEDAFDTLSAGNYNKAQVNNLLERLETQVTEAESKTWLQRKIIEWKTVRKEQETDVQKDLESNGRAFLNAVLDILLKRSLEGSKVGVLYVQGEVPLYRNKERDTLQKPIQDTMLTIKEVEVKFEAGQISGIAIKGYLDDFRGRVLTFHNRVPISFSTKFDVSLDYYIVRNIEVYCKDYVLDGYHVNLNEVLYNDYKLSNYTNNYSPIDTVILLKPFEVGKVIFRERATDILQARIFSDFIGYGGDQPNGLVQVEFSKSINLKTTIRKNGAKRDATSPEWEQQKQTTQCGKPEETTDMCHRNLFKLNRYKKIHTYEWFRYTIPMIAITKIEKEEKFLDVSLNADSTGNVTAINLMKYSNFRAGLQHNILKASRPEFHSSFTWDASFYMMLTGINNHMTTADSTVAGTTFFTNTSSQTNALFFNMSPLVLSWNIYPHNIYHVSLTGKLQYISEANKDFNFIEKERRLGQWVYHLGLFAGIKPSETGNGQFFVRVLIDMNAVYMDQRYYQAQVGYAIKVFSRKSEFKSRPVFN